MTTQIKQTTEWYYLPAHGVANRLDTKVDAGLKSSEVPTRLAVVALSAVVPLVVEVRTALRLHQALAQAGGKERPQSTTDCRWDH